MTVLNKCLQLQLKLLSWFGIYSYRTNKQYNLMKVKFEKYVSSEPPTKNSKRNY